MINYNELQSGDIEIARCTRISINVPLSWLMLAGGELHRDVRAARVLRRLFHDWSGVSARRRGGSPILMEERPHVREGGHPRREQGRPGSQSTGIDRRYVFFLSLTPIIDVSLATSFVRMVYEDTREWKFLRVFN